jgi:hypothetical protein
MNKAFLREPDESGALNCPACGSLGIAVTRETWQQHVVEAARAGLAETAFFCPFPKCDVAYFDMFDRRLKTDSLARGVYPKDPRAPICPCFGLTTADIEADVREGVVTRTRANVEKAKSHEARCLAASPSGQSCVGEVQRYYMKAKAADE